MLPNSVFEFGHSFEDALDGFAVVLGLKGSLSGDEAVEEDPGSPDIYFFAVASACEHLRGSVVEGACDGHHVELLAPLLESLADAEIDDLDLSLVLIVEDVLQLDVAMGY